jgi:hypothetical protein
MLKEMSNILNHKGNVNKNDIEIPSYSNQNACHRGHKNNGYGGEGDPYTLLVGMQSSSVNMEINMEVPQKTKNETTI